MFGDLIARSRVLDSALTLNLPLVRVYGIFVLESTLFDEVVLPLPLPGGLSLGRPLSLAVPLGIGGIVVFLSDAWFSFLQGAQQILVLLSCHLWN